MKKLRDYNSGNPIFTFTLNEIQSAIENLSGFCISCGAERSCCEPDAAKYSCEACGKHDVYGAEEIVLMGLIFDE